tara:strand:- start:971 stop:1873 length:903 start_codon:yes stop_codon:yes gene_type:complete
MITNPITSIKILNDIAEITPIHSNALSAYASWALELGVSDTISLDGLVEADDSSAEIDVGFIYTSGGTDSKLMQSTEGSIGFYTNPSTFSNSARAITKVLSEQVSIPRTYTTRILNPDLIISCKHPDNDSKSYDVKWQKTSDTMILFLKWSAYNSSESKRVDFAMRMTKGAIDIVCNTNIDAGAFFQIFLMDSTTSSSSAIDGTGNFAKSLLPSTTYQFKSIIPRLLTGTVIGADGNFAALPIRAYDRVTGKLMGNTTSDAITGEYSIETTVYTEHYIVCLDDSVNNLNALIIDRVVPIG